MTKIGIGITGVPFSINQKGGDVDPDYQFQVSYNPLDPTCVVVTGVDTYRFLQIEGQGSKYEFLEEHIQVNSKDREISTKYVCHCWMPSDGRLIVCTESSEIFLCDSDGGFLNYIPESPTDDPFKIEACMAYSRGFIVSGNDNQSGKFYVFDKCEDPRIAYRLISSRPYVIKVDLTNLQSNINFQISSMAISFSEDYVFFTTKSNQIMKADIPLYDGAEVIPKFDFVHCLYHTQEITGLDVCIRKQLCVTCSKDRTIKLWNYHQKTLEITQVLQEDALAVAFHPSGFHVIVAVQDKIILFNVLAKTLHNFKSLPIKNCREI